MGLQNSISGSKNKQTFYLDFDDYSSVSPGSRFLRQMKEHYPNFKCTLFTVPFHLRYFTRELKIEKLDNWGKLVRNTDWIEIAPHGFAHLKGEMMEKNPKKALTIIKAMENLFGKIGIKFVKIFKAPYWEVSKEVEEVLKEREYTLAIDRNNPVVHTDIPTYVFNWSIEEPIPNYHTVRGHGHMYGMANGLDKCYINLLKIPQDAEFKFVSQWLEQ